MKRTVSLTHSLTHSLTILLVIILLFLPVSAALAGYLGPDRTRTESDVETYDYGVWASRDDLSCSPTNDPPACIQCTWERDPFTAPCAINPPTDRYYWYKLGTRSEVVTRTVTYPEAVINGALNGCTLQNGWCVTSPALALNASEPVAGYAITLIEGARNGEAFACNGASCDVPLLEGENNFTFWALSSWGDSSRMGTLTARVDTQPPLVNGEISGTPGEAGWYVSPVTVRASASDPQPGSGIQALTYALNGGAWTPYTAPLTVSDGVHSVTFRAADAAGHSAEASASVRVDTLPPQVDASLAGEQVNGWYLSQVTLSASASDPSAGSGLARIEYAPDGGAWQSYAVPVTFGGGTHTVQVRAIDMAGNLSEPAWLTFRVDGTAPRIQLSDAWYIWQTGEVKVSDEGSGLAGVEIQIRDGQGRWQKVVRAYEVNGGSFSTSIAWDRTFADGTLAPIGTYDVMVTARDLAGNESRETARILIPAPGVTPSPLPTRRVEPAETRIPQPQTTDNCPLMTDDCSLPAPTAAPQSSFILSPTRAAVVSAFQSSARQSPNLQSNNLQSNNRQSPAPLFGAAALAAIAAATAYALEQRRKRKDEEARQRAEAQREAARRNAAEEARKAQAYLLAQIAAQQAAQEQSASHRGEEAKIERMEEAEGTAKTAKPQRDEQAYQDYRAGERNAEAIAAEYQVRKAVQEYRQGERADVVTLPPACTVENVEKPKSWWQRANDWLQGKVNRFVTQPPSWLSVSYSPQEFSLGNYTAAHWVSYQPLARNLWEGIAYQQVEVGLKMKPTLTTNPDGVVDINLGDGTITFNGKNSNFFIQPTALSFGWGTSAYQSTDATTGIIHHAINRQVVDVDLFGENMLSFKVSHATGTEDSRIINVNGTDVKKMLETELDVTVNVHRWPRVIAAVAAVYFVFEAGVTAIAPRVLPWAAEKIPAIAPLLGVP